MAIPIDGQVRWKPQYTPDTTSLFDLVRQTAKVPPPRPQSSRALEQARWAWQWGPPYAPPGSPPIAQELSMIYNIQPDVVDKMRGVPVSLAPRPDWGTTMGQFIPDQYRMELREPFNPSLALHEYMHAWDTGWGKLPGPGYVSARPSWLLGGGYGHANQFVPSIYTGWGRIPESLAYAGQKYAPLQRWNFQSRIPPSQLMPTLSQFFAY